jgi:hypothetical protein
VLKKDTVGAHSHLVIYCDSTEPLLVHILKSQFYQTPGVNMIHSLDRSYVSLDKESLAGDHSTHGDEDLAVEMQHERFLDSSEPMAEGGPEAVARGHTGLSPDEAIQKTSMRFDLPLYTSDETHRQTFYRLQMLADSLKIIDDGPVPEDVDIQAEDDGCVPDNVEILADPDNAAILADLALARGLVDVQVEADSTSQATTMNQSSHLTVLGGGVLSKRLESEKLDSTPVRRGGAGGNEVDSVEDALHKADNESLRSGSLFMPHIDDKDKSDVDTDDSGASPSRNIMLISRVVPGVDSK